MKKTFALSLIAVISKVAVAQSTEIVTDRPDITESAEVVPTEWLQGEHGFQYTFSRHPQFDLASSLLRFGINTHTELRLGIEPSIGIEEPTNLYNQQLSIGAKSILLNKSRYQFGLLTTLSTGFTESDANNLNHAADIVLLGAVDLFAFWSIGYNLGSNWQSNESGTLVNYSVSNALALGNYCSYFIEIFGQLNSYASNTTAIDIGFTYLLNNNLQLDLSGGYFFNEETTFLSTGFAYRFAL